MVYIIYKAVSFRNSFVDLCMVNSEFCIDPCNSSPFLFFFVVLLIILKKGKYLFCTRKSTRCSEVWSAVRTE